MLGDEVMVSFGPNQESLARVVAIGINLVANDIDESFYSWAKSEEMIGKDIIVVEWLGQILYCKMSWTMHLSAAI